MIEHTLKLAHSSRLLHYIVTGGVSAIVDIGGVYIVRSIFPNGLALAVIVGFFAGFLVNFAMNKLWTFQKRGDGYRKTQRQFVLYVLLVAFNLLFTYLVIRLLSSIGVELLYAKVFTIGCTTLWNYVLYKKYIFKKHSQDAQ